MNARKLFSTLLATALVGVSTAPAWAAVGTAKARGDYRPGAFQLQRDSGSRVTYARRAPVYRSYSAPVIASPAPIVAQAPAPLVAQAPAEGRRYSYAPAASDATAATPCPPTVAVPQAGRRYSYAPAEASAAPAPTYAPRAYSSRPSYSGRSGGSGTNPNFPLLKTDPRKYNTR